MIYFDHGATSFPKPLGVRKAVEEAMRRFTNPGRGGYAASMDAAQGVYRCRQEAAQLFHCLPEQVAFTMNCTHGLNMAIRTLVHPGERVVISGFEHNAVTRPLHHLSARVEVAGRKLFSPEDTLEDFERILRTAPRAAIFTHQSNVFGYILPVKELAELCRRYEVPFIVDAAQSAGSLEIDFEALGADFIAMPGHKGLQGPMGTGLLLCGRLPEPLMQGGTGSMSQSPQMPDFLPDRAEPGTVNVPGIWGLHAGLQWVRRRGVKRIGEHEGKMAQFAARELEKLGFRVFRGEHQGGVVSFLPEKGDCEEWAERLGKRGFCLRAGLHCAPLAHESGGTLQTGTIRLSCGPDTTENQLRMLLRQMPMCFSEKQDFLHNSPCHGKKNPL